MKKQSDSSSGKARRFAAVLGLLAIAFCFIGMFYNILTDGDPMITLMFLFFVIVVPTVAYVLVMFSKKTAGKHEEDD